MTNHLIIYVVLFSIIVLVGQLFRKSTIPVSLLLVVTGILLSLIPTFPTIELNSQLVLNIFLPLMIYQISSFSSWRNIKKNLLPISLLSIGHVIFITLLIASAFKYFLPQLSWPLAIILGAVVSPPDDVAIVAIAEKIRIPEKVLTILEGEAMFNDAAALIIFRFALIAFLTQEFSTPYAFLYFLCVIVGETIYGILIGLIMGEIRTYIKNSSLHMIASVLTPFVAYLPAESMGGSGILATAVTGFIIGNYYSLRFTPELRLFSRAFWPTLFLGLQTLLFLLIGLNMHWIWDSISSIPINHIMFYSMLIISCVVIGRFFWVYVVMLMLPRIIFSSLKKKRSRTPWQFPFLISWAGMRGGISLAAALAIPSLPLVIDGVSPRALILFLTMAVIVFTLLVQGLSLPWLLEKIGITKFSATEEYDEHVSELKARFKMTKAALIWLKSYQEEIKEDKDLLERVEIYIQEYTMRKANLKSNLSSHEEFSTHYEAEEKEQEISMLAQIIEVEKAELFRLWREEKISHKTRNNLLEKLDHRLKHISG